MDSSTKKPLLMERWTHGQINNNLYSVHVSMFASINNNFVHLSTFRFNNSFFSLAVHMSIFGLANNTFSPVSMFRLKENISSKLCTCVAPRPGDPTFPAEFLCAAEGRSHFPRFLCAADEVRSHFPQICVCSLGQVPVSQIFVWGTAERLGPRRPLFQIFVCSFDQSGPTGALILS